MDHRVLKSKLHQVDVKHYSPKGKALLAYAKKIQAGDVKDKLSGSFHPLDKLLGLDYQEVIDTVHANVGENATSEDVMREFEAIVTAQLSDARYLMKKFMKQIMLEL